MRIYIVTEEKWAAGAVEGVVRCGVFGSLALAKEAAAEFQRLSSAPEDPENFSYLIEEEPVVRRGHDIIAEPGRSWRWWPALEGKFATV